MGIITDAVSSALGLSSSGGWEWQSHIHQASFCGVPFGVIAGEGVYGRRVAVHEYPYRDTVWVEDLGRSARKFTLRGFLIQDSLVYSAGDVFSQRDALVAACETSGGGLLVHPTLGEMTVYVPDGGLRIEEGVESGRVFSFTLTVIESGEKAFSLVTGTTSTSSETWYQTLTTTATVTLAAITGEMNSVTGTVKTIKSTVSAWKTIFSRAVTSVTSMTSTVSSLYSPDSYGRYCRGSDTPSGSTASSLATWLATTDADDDSILETIQACSVQDRSAAESATAVLEDITSVSGAVSAIQAVIITLAEATGSDTEKIRVMAEIASAEDG
ncbi:TPA: DNA circularization N-terminal domain-containing protein, partial [Escherichia coli]|nr:DNA circularization N-terminal domain-containing protein [Escherichia coli]